MTANIIIAGYKYALKQTWLVFMSVGRTLWAAGGYDREMNFQSFQINRTTLLQRYVPGPSGFNVCACSVARNCPDPNWSGAQFLCHYGDNCAKGTVVWSIPGFVKSCMNLDSMLDSDLRCLYDKTCLDTLLSMYNIDMPKREPLPSATLNISVLDSSASSSFRPDNTIETIFGELMIDNWHIRTNYAGYYNNCAPAKCTYRITRRMDVFYVITTITTFFGGLAVTLRLLIPLCVRFLYWIFTCRQNHHSNIDDRRPGKYSSGKLSFLLNSKM